MPIIKFAICLSFYILGGMATTNILRLGKGSVAPVEGAKCFCDACGSEVKLTNQFPIFSYIARRGKCGVCGAKIPVSSFIIETVIFIGMCAVAGAFHFSAVGILFSFVYFETVKIIYIIVKGKRENNFIKEYVKSVFLNAVPFLLVEFMALLLKTF